MARAKRKSRPARWLEAAGRAREAIDKMQAAKSELSDAFDELNDIKGEYEEWKDGLPENLQGGTLADKLGAICDMEFDVDQTVDELEELVSAAEEPDFPLGFGRD